MIRAERLNPCDGCRSESLYQRAPEFAGLNGIMDDAAIQSMTAGSSVLMSSGAIAQGAITGGLIGGLAAGSWRGAGTGALLAGGLGGTLAGGALLLVSGSNPELRVGGGIGLAVGLVALIAGGLRARKAIRGK